MILKNITEAALVEELKGRFIKKFKLNPADKNLYKVSVFERRLTMRMHNSFKELIRPQVINFLPPIFEDKKD